MQTEINLNYLLIFTEFAKKYLDFEDTNLKHITSTQITNAIAGLPNKLEALSNPKFLNVENLDSNFIDSISPKQIEKYFISNKITLAEDLFRVLSSIDKEKTIQKFKRLNRQTLCQAFLVPELNYSQTLENINKLKNKVFKDELINGNIEIIEILSAYLSIYTKDFRRYKRVGISDYFKGYYFGLLISRNTIESYCKSDFLDKLSTNNHNNIEIASVFQFLRRISEETNGELDKELSRFLVLNTDNFIQAIRNENITKTLSGLSELAITRFDIYGDDLLFRAKKSIIKKVEQRKNEKIYSVKLIPDLEKIAKNKGKIILKELKK